MLVVAILAQLAIAAHGPDTATACLPVRVSAAIRTPGPVAPAVEPPQGSGLQLLRSRVSSRVESDGAAQFSTITEAWADIAISYTGEGRMPGREGLRVVQYASLWNDQGNGSQTGRG